MYILTKYLPQALLLVSLLAMSACTSNEALPLGQPQPMQFEFFLKEGNEVKPVTKAVAGDLTNTGILLYCLYTGEAKFQRTGPATLYPPIHWATPVDDNGHTTDGSKTRYWMNSQKAYYSFWACSNTLKNNDYPSGTSWGCTPKKQDTRLHSPTCSFRQLNDPKLHIDFLIADQVLDVQYNYIAPVVGLYFTHALSQVKIRFYNSHGTQLNDCVAKITYPSNPSNPSKIVQSCDIRLESGIADVFNPITPSSHTGTHTIHDGTFTVTASSTSPDYATMAGDLMLLPQSIQGDFISVELSYRPEGMLEVQTASVDLPLPSNSKLEKGAAYTYNIDVIVETTSLKVGEVLLSDWEGQNSTVVDWTTY